LKKLLVLVDVLISVPAYRYFAASTDLFGGLPIFLRGKGVEINGCAKHVNHTSVSK
jgi:hypothetical protein